MENPKGDLIPTLLPKRREKVPLYLRGYARERDLG
jgi:hypothetical protein